MGDLLTGLLSGLASAATVLSFLWGFIAQLKRDLRLLETEKVNGIARQLEHHLAADRSQHICAVLERLSGDISKMDAKLDRMAEETARQAAQIEANRAYVENLDRSLERHKNGDHYHA